MNYYYLEVVKGLDRGKRYAMPDGAVSLGRSSENNIAINTAEKGVSGHHAIIYKTPDRILLQDMQSTNGTFVNEERIKEQELNHADILGLGLQGPRLKLLISDCELPLQNALESNAAVVTTSLRTKEEHHKLPLHEVLDSTAHENQETITRIKNLDKEEFFPSHTMELEKNIRNKSLHVEDVHHLFKDGKRLQKIIDRGNVDTTQMRTISMAYTANKKMRNQLLLVIAGIVLISLAACSFFAIRYFQYRSMLGHGLSLEAKIDSFENRIAQANKNPAADRRLLDSLVRELETNKTQLEQVKSKVRQDDYARFYSDPIERNIDAILQRFGETNYHIPPEMTARVKYHIGIYSGKLKPTIQRYINRKQLYFPMIQRILREKNLPADLAYVSMLESGFNDHALSSAGARGLWQFMAPTGQRYGLTVDNNVDERILPEKATYAAAEYFKDLIGIFGGQSSLMLAMAAYNAGEGRVMGALRKIDNPMRNRDFWYIYRMGYLAEETNEYIPRVIALIIISENSQRYGFVQGTAIATARSSGAGTVTEAENDFIPLQKNQN